MWFCAKETSYAKAINVAERSEGISQKRGFGQAVRETVIDLARESYGDTIPLTTPPGWTPGGGDGEAKGLGFGVGVGNEFGIGESG